jgi:hypothetical protein
MFAEDKEKILRFLLETANEGKDFVIENAPETIQQLIAYNYYSSLFILWVFVPLLIVSLVTFVVTTYLSNKTNDDLCCVLAWLTFFTSVLFSVIVTVVAYTLMKIIYAPNVFVLEWLGIV